MDTDEAITLLAVTVAALAVTVVFLSGWIFSEHRSVVRMRKQRDELQYDRNVWRDIARDSMRVVEVVQSVNRRAARIAETVAKP